LIAGPLGDEIGGGRIYVLLEAGQEGLAWTYFDAIPEFLPIEGLALEGLGGAPKGGVAAAG